MKSSVPSLLTIPLRSLLLRVLLLLSCLLTIGSAWGGTYQVVSITGGQGSYVSYPDSQTYGFGFTQVNGLRTASGRFEASRLQLSGPLTATFKWVPTDPNDPFDVPHPR